MPLAAGSQSEARCMSLLTGQILIIAAGVSKRARGCVCVCVWREGAARKGVPDQRQLSGWPRDEPALAPGAGKVERMLVVVKRRAAACGQAAAPSSSAKPAHCAVATSVPHVRACVRASARSEGRGAGAPVPPTPSLVSGGSSSLWLLCMLTVRHSASSGASVRVSASRSLQTRYAVSGGFPARRHRTGSPRD